MEILNKTDFNSLVSGEGTCETIRYPSLNIKFNRIGKHDNNTNSSHRHIQRKNEFSRSLLTLITES